MKNLVLAAITIIVLDLLFTGCANPISPTGGPKDTIPPTLINSMPVNGSINFEGQEIILEFDEYVNADKLNQNLIITPKTDVRFKHIIKKNQLRITFDEPFGDSTTYSLNFFDGVTDITERNPAVNLVLAFSTGTFIDSIQVTGKVSDLMTQEPSSKYVVGLYPLTDTLDFLVENPTYFTTTNDSGTFDINYIKTGLYRILTFDDANKNLLFDPAEEQHGFLVDTLNLLTSALDLEMSTLLQDIRPITLTNNRPIGTHHELKYNKRIDEYTISPDSIFSSIEGDKKDVLRLYNKGQFNVGDSTSVIVTALDSLSNSTTDTLKVVFLESKRKLAEFKTTVKYSDKILINDPSYLITFNKPVISIDSSKFVYQADTLFSSNPDSISLEWNDNRTSVNLITYLNSDTLFNSYDQAFAIDTMKIDTVKAQLTDSISRGTPPTGGTRKPKLEFATLKGAFISVENDTSTVQKVPHQRTTRTSIGTLKLKIETEETSFTVQLLSNNGTVKYQASNNKNPSFDVDPSSYKVRVLIDTDGDGEWSYGNLIRNIQPERVYLFPEEIPVRENWIVEDYVISF